MAETPLSCLLNLGESRLAKAPTRRVWDSCTIIDYLSGASRASPHCHRIIDSASRGETEIIVSTLAAAEVANIKEQPGTAAEEMIQEFFGRDYVIQANVDMHVSKRARELVRNYPPSGNLKRLGVADAIHLATALHWKIPILESYDDKLLERINADRHLLGAKILLRHPQYEGQVHAGNLLS